MIIQKSFIKNTQDKIELSGNDIQQDKSRLIHGRFSHLIRKRLPLQRIKSGQRLRDFWGIKLCSAFLLLSLLLCPFLAPAVHGTTAELSPAEALSYFLLNCAYFSKWQGDNDPQVSKVLRIGVLGRDTLGKTLDVVSERAQSSWFANGRILIERSYNPMALKNSHIVFVNDSESDKLNSILAAFQGEPVLLVSEMNGFARYGGTIEVSIKEEHLRFILNLDALKRIHIDVSSRMKQRASAFIEHGVSRQNTFMKEDGQ